MTLHRFNVGRYRIAIGRHQGGRLRIDRHPEFRHLVTLWFPGGRVWRVTRGR